MGQYGGTRSRDHRAGGHSDRTSLTHCLSLFSLSPSLLTLQFSSLHSSSSSSHHTSLALTNSPLVFALPHPALPMLGVLGPMMDLRS